MPTPRRYAAALSGVALALWAPSVARATGASATPLEVAVTGAPQKWLVEQIGGERVRVTALVAPGDSAETYLPTDAQATGVMRSAVYFRVGVASENSPWFDALERSGTIEIVDLRDGVELLAAPHVHEPGEHDVRSGIEKDPHIWLSPRRLKQQARTVAETLTRLDPDAGGDGGRRLASFEQRLDHLDAELRRLLAPHSGRSFLVVHPAWGYFAADYGLRQLTLELEGKAPGEAEVTALQGLAREHGVRVVFVEPQTTRRGAETLASALGGRTDMLDPLAADVAANLEDVAARLAASFDEAASAAAVGGTAVGGPGHFDDDGIGTGAAGFFRDLGANPFLATGLAAGLLASLACGIVGPFVVTRRIVFLGGAVAHVAVGGLGAAIFLQYAAPAVFGWLRPLHGAAAAAVAAALVLARLDPAGGHRTGGDRPVAADTVIGALWATGMAIGILLIKLTPGYHTELMSYLFGNLAYVSAADVRLMLGLDAVIVATVLLYHKRFVALCLDPEQARLQGVPVRRTSAVLLVLVALTVITLTHVVGLILVIALLSLPAATAGLLVRRLPPMIALSVVIAALSTTVPRIAVYGTRVSPEPAIVLAAGVLFLMAAGWRGWRRRAG